MTDMVKRVEQAIRDNIEASLPDGCEVDFHYAAVAAIQAMHPPADEISFVLDGLDSRFWNGGEPLVAIDVDAALSTKEE